MHKDIILIIGISLASLQKRRFQAFIIIKILNVHS